ncbi:ABC transporter permease [Lactococcus insecticola]|uniref:Transport permease protein n=1 Tax=Pseudolactococcus insecticola TaxID=2709158 RepID=A0A6A0B414_9LACT|nr:ABC transporter permease [Lactococcus insecticola]GFH40089.1 transport permease protein [Lactococcus insecticola]
MDTINTQITPQNSVVKALKDTFTFAKRSLLKIYHNPEKLFDVTFTPVLFTLMFAFLFGGAIAGDMKAYLPTLIPGVLVQTLLTATSATGVSMREDIEKGVFDRFKSLPIARIAPLAGPLVADIVRYFIATVIVMVTGLILGWKIGGSPIYVALAILLAVLFSWSLSWIFAYVGQVVKSSGAITGISMTITMLLSFLSNAFIPVKTLPKFLQSFVNVNPVSHFITALRDLLNNGTINSNFWSFLLFSVIIVAIFAPLTTLKYSKTI